MGAGLCTAHRFVQSHLILQVHSQFGVADTREGSAAKSVSCRGKATGLVQQTVFHHRVETGIDALIQDLTVGGQTEDERTEWWARALVRGFDLPPGGVQDLEGTNNSPRVLRVDGGGAVRVQLP